ncbi:MAG TPA: hypothetical protein VLY21_07920 [Nitrososphaerales archaeon]|nr:hypothetical protein [Nitrososphaerales archaeon]
MNQGLWVWPADPKEQRRLIKEFARSRHLTAALTAVAKSKEGLSNAELDDILSDNSNWMTLWVTRQLSSLGLIEYKVDFFGNPGRYALTDLGKEAYPKIIGQPVPSPPPVQAAPPRPPAPPAPAPASAAVAMPPKPPEAKPRA